MSPFPPPLPYTRISLVQSPPPLSPLGSNLHVHFNIFLQSSDSQLLGEMMFGSMPLKLAGNSVKIHYIRSQHQLILTKIFTANYRSLPTCRVGDFSDSCPLPVDNCYIDTSSPADCGGGSSSRLRVPSVSPGEYMCHVCIVML